jgi:hypothetical protein
VGQSEILRRRFNFHRAALRSDATRISPIFHCQPNQQMSPPRSGQYCGRANFAVFASLPTFPHPAKPTDAPGRGPVNIMAERSEAARNLPFSLISAIFAPFSAPNRTNKPPGRGRVNIAAERASSRAFSLGSAAPAPGPETRIGHHPVRAPSDRRFRVNAVKPLRESREIRGA